MARSIRSRILTWHALTLISVVAGLGTIFVLNLQWARYREIDAELESAAQALVSVLRAYPPPELRRAAGEPDPFGPSGEPIGPMRGRDRSPEFDRPNSGPEGRPRGIGRPEMASDMGNQQDSAGLESSGDFGRAEEIAPRARGFSPQEQIDILRQFGFDEGPDFPGGPGPIDGRRGPPGAMRVREQARLQMERLQAALVLPIGFVERHRERERSEPYFLIRLQDGEILKRQGNFPDGRGRAVVFRRRGVDAGQLRQIGPWRELTMNGPSGTQVIVGRSIASEMNDLWRWTWFTYGTGVVVLLAGLLTGWLISERVVQSVKTISSDASNMNENNLEKRIDLKKADTELVQLADTLNRTFDRLQNAFSRQRQFTADASHELRTPLTVVLGNLELSLASDHLEAGQRSSLEAAQRAARRMKALLEHLLTLARADAGALAIACERFDLADVASECVELVTNIAQDQQVTIESQLEPAELLGDMRLISQVVLNLLTNAIQYNRPGGFVRVTVSLNDKADSCVLKVKDNGIGIPKSDQGKVFERFYRADASRSRRTGGNGLGLAISKSIVEAHNGSIRFESVPDSGSTFIVTIPVGSSQSKPCEVASSLAE